MESLAWMTQKSRKWKGNDCTCWREEMGGFLSEEEVFSGSEEKNIEGEHPAQLNGFHNVSTLSSPGWQEESLREYLRKPGSSKREKCHRSWGVFKGSHDLASYLKVPTLCLLSIYISKLESQRSWARTEGRVEGRAGLTVCSRTIVHLGNSPLLIFVSSSLKWGVGDDAPKQRAKHPNWLW